ncbi:sigma-70 family RNA polymerase sigma factor [Candidatus Poribacteria bacterium]|nr:sigma-70 family RNA polymerase sigma factor [Candidatus Poribacteria bacterium]
MTESNRTPEPSSDLRRRFHSGEAEATGHLTELFFHDVARFSHALLADAEQAMDAAQETFLRMFEQHRRYDSARPFRPWLFGIARNCCLEIRRNSAMQAARVIELDAIQTDSGAFEDHRPSARDELLRMELERDARILLDGLDESARAIVWLHLFEGLTFREIAGAVERPAATVATTYYRALARLRRTLESDESTGSDGHGK